MVDSTAMTASLRNYLTMGQAEFGKAIRGSITPELLIRATLTYAQKSPKVFECTKESIAKCLMDCASLGLLPDGTLGTAYLVPYGNQCTLIIGYRGMIDLARRSDKLTQIEARVVREGDTFQLRFLSGVPPIHEPKIGDSASRKVVGAYAVAYFHNGEKQIEFMDLSEIEAVRNRSRAGKSGPWQTDFAEMAKKTVVRRLMKYLPLTPEMSESFDAADREFIQDADVVTPAQDAQPAAKPKSKAATIAKNLEHKPTLPLPQAQPQRETVEAEPQGTREVQQEPEGEYASNLPPETEQQAPTGNDDGPPADELTVKTAIPIKFLPGGKTLDKKYLDKMDASECAEAREFAKANIAQGSKVSFYRGILNLLDKGGK